MVGRFIGGNRRSDASRHHTIRTLAHGIEEYLFPSKHPPRTEYPASLLTEVIQSKEKEMASHGIRTGMIVKETLPKVPLDGQFDRALRGVIDFSRALCRRRRPRN